MRIVSLVRTCDACPSQWEGYDDHGHAVYVRYRWGYLSIRRSERPTSDIIEAVCGPEIVGKRVGDEYGGYMTDEELRKHAAEEGIEMPKGRHHR